MKKTMKGRVPKGAPTEKLSALDEEDGGWGLCFAAMARSSASTPAEKAQTGYAWRVQAGQLDPASAEGQAAFHAAYG